MFNIINHILVCVSVFLLAGVSSSLSLSLVFVLKLKVNLKIAVIWDG